MDLDSGLAMVTPGQHDAAVRARRELLARHGVTTEPDNEFDEIAACVGRETGLRYSFVNFYLDRQHFVGLHNPPADSNLPVVGRDMDRRDGWCPHVVKRKLGLPLPNVHASRLFSGNRVANTLNIHSYFGEPLIYPDPELGDVALGTVCGIDPEVYDPRKADLVMGILEGLARDVVVSIQARSPRLQTVTPPSPYGPDPHATRLWH